MSARRLNLGWIALLLPGVTFAAALPHAMPCTGQAGMQDMAADCARRPVEDARAVPVDATKAAALPPNGHVPPPPPGQTMSPMPATALTDAMQMDDHARLDMLMFQRLERDVDEHGDASTVWDTQGWWGGDVDRLWLDSEGERDGNGTHDAYAEALWGHAVASFWDTRLGVRHDLGQGPSREWIAAGVEGLAPYWFELNATFYAGPRGRTAAHVEVDYDLYLTQRLVLRPSLELNAYGKDDPQRDVHAGLSDGELGLRLRYEFSRRFAPYVGASWNYRHAPDAVRLPPWQPPGAIHAFVWLAGVRFWF